MEENKNARRRERIKTILIIFLAILLVLTFFSNTIMNHSLPTVSAQYAGYGQITEKVRGSGIVTANQNYTVVAEGNRKVASVHAKVGDEIKAGDKLFVLEAGEDDEEIKAAEDGIREAELAYQKALLTVVPDYAKENQAIADARSDLQTSINRLNAARSQAGTGISASAYQQASKKASDASDKLMELKGYLSLLETGETAGIPAKYTAAASNAETAYIKANAELEAAKTILETKTSALTVTSAEQQATLTTLERAAETAETAAARAKADSEAAPDDLELKRAMEDAASAAKYAKEDAEAAKKTLEAIQTAEKEIAEAQEAVNTAAAAAETANKARNDAAGTISAAINQDIASVQAELDSANQIVNAYSEQSETVDIATLEEAVSTNEKALQGLIIDLAETKKTDDIEAKSAALDLQSQQLAIDKQKEALEKLKKDAGTVTITSKNDGIVSAVNVAAGDSVTDGMELANISLTSSGYTVSFSVTPEQARRVKVGTIAEVTNNYYSDITAKLLSARTDPKNPSSQDKLLTFEITGKDVTAGQMLALSITCSSQNYDCVVPSSAIMEDKDGKFVLVMQSKSTPLGNRYYANRVTVSVLASDDINSAVQGEISQSDFVITTSEKPLTPGAQVRMEES